jgi:hypothetical protein
MHDIPMKEPSPEFAECWRAAGRHLESQATFDGRTLAWLRARLEPPCVEHLSFRMGNQLFFVRVEGPESPGTLVGLQAIADGCKGHACVMPMRKVQTRWEAILPGWGLMHAQTLAAVEPPKLVTDEVIEMTDWEVQDFAVQVVRNQLEKEGRTIMSAQGNPQVNPSLWFVGDQGPEWVVVRAARFPKRDASPPANWEAIAASCAKLSTRGHFASVGVTSADDPTGGGLLRRGAPMYANFSGLVRKS